MQWQLARLSGSARCALITALLIGHKLPTHPVTLPQDGRGQSLYPPVISLASQSALFSRENSAIGYLSPFKHKKINTNLPYWF